jgi:hypothetical protein
MAATSSRDFQDDQPEFNLPSENVSFTKTNIQLNGSLFSELENSFSTPQKDEEPTKQSIVETKETVDAPAKEAPKEIPTEEPKAAEEKPTTSEIKETPSKPIEEEPKEKPSTSEPKRRLSFKKSMDKEPQQEDAKGAKKKHSFSDIETDYFFLVFFHHFLILRVLLP